MIKSFLAKHKQTFMNHVKLLSVIAGIILFTLCITGVFGKVLAGWVWVGIVVGGLFLFYMFVYEMTFNPGAGGNGFD